MAPKPFRLDLLAKSLPCRPEADALFISRGARPTIEIIEALDARIGKPVVTSNQAMAWDALRLAGVEDRVVGYPTFSLVDRRHGTQSAKILNSALHTGR